jgi:hypothetical protein
VEVEERLLPRIGVSRWSHQEHTGDDRYAHGAETMEEDGRLENPRQARPLNLWVELAVLTVVNAAEGGPGL